MANLGEICGKLKFCQDDMWFSAHLALKGIRRFVLGAALGVQDFGFFLDF